MNIKLITPVKGELTYDGIISQKFGECGSPKLCELYKEMGLTFHNGLDLRGDRTRFPKGRGTPICASHNGDVIYAQEFKSISGRCIKVMDESKTFYTIYAHNEEMLVKTGDKVVAGQQIATMGNSGSEYYYMDVHLHFGLYECDKDGNRLNTDNGYGGAIDPLPFILSDTTMKTLLIGNNETKDVFMKINHKRYWIWNPAMFHDYFIERIIEDWNAVKWLPPEEINKVPLVKMSFMEFWKQWTMK